MTNAAAPSVFAGSRCLVTGGLGFIGSNLALRLQEVGAAVTVLDCLWPETGGNDFNLSPAGSQITIVRGDQRISADVERAVAGQAFVFNLVGLVSHVDSLSKPLDDLEVNCRAQIVLLEAVRNRAPEARVVFSGTRGQYGAVPDRPIDETYPFKPTDINGIDKVAGESYHLLYHRLYGLRATSLRLSNTYGPRHQMRHSRQGVVNWFLRQILDGGVVTLYGTGEQKRDLTYVSDVVDALMACAATESTVGQAYNLGGASHSLCAIVEAMVRLAGSGSVSFVPFPDQARRIEIGSYTADTGKIRSATGWAARVGLEEGVQLSIDYYSRHKERYW